MGNKKSFCKAGEINQTNDVNDQNTRRIIASNPNTPKEVLMFLAQDLSTTIRQRVAENLRTPPETLSKLADDNDTEVRLAVAENPNSNAAILTKLSNDESIDVRFGVAENPHMPEDILIKLADDDNPYVRCRALQTLQRMSLHSQARLNLLLQSCCGKHTTKEN
jgi:HEAT repeat protein